MKINSLQVVNFRKYTEKQITFDGLVTLIHGPNGGGKTSLLEALYMASVGKSPRTNRDTVVILHAADSASVGVDFVHRQVEQKIRLKIHRRDRKEMTLNDTPVKQKELVETLQTIFFGPDDIQLVKGGPQPRRRFLDLSLARANPLYYDALLRYNRVLAQRNRCLKIGDESSAYGWDEQLAQQAAYITAARLGAIEAWNRRLQEVISEISDTKTQMRLRYLRPYAAQDDPDTESYRRMLAANRERDMRYGYTSVGPHRGDWRLERDTWDMARYGSQGEQRLAVLALKLCEIDFLQEQTGERPILLLDDVLSELDKRRRLAFLAWIDAHRIQMIITGTDIPRELEGKMQQIELDGEGHGTME